MREPIAESGLGIMSALPPESGHVRRNYGCQLSAKSGHKGPHDGLKNALHAGLSFF